MEAMSIVAKVIEREFKKLTPGEQAELYDRLGSVLYGDPEEDAALIRMLRRRVAEIEAGKVKGIPVEKTYQKIKRALR